MHLEAVEQESLGQQTEAGKVLDWQTENWLEEVAADKEKVFVLEMQLNRIVPLVQHPESKDRCLDSQ